MQRTYIRQNAVRRYGRLIEALENQRRYDINRECDISKRCYIKGQQNKKDKHKPRATLVRYTEDDRNSIVDNRYIQPKRNIFYKGVATADSEHPRPPKTRCPGVH
jgi:hypothetical protein